MGPRSLTGNRSPDLSASSELQYLLRYPGGLPACLNYQVKISPILRGLPDNERDYIFDTSKRRLTTSQSKRC